MDIITYGKVVKVANEIKEAREGNGSLDARLDKISLGNVTSVVAKHNLPAEGIPGAIYAVVVDESNQNLPTTYLFNGTYERLGGSVVAFKSNGILSINGADVTVYEHPQTHSADILTDGVTNKAFTADERSKLADIEEGANNYEHPPTHAADMLVDGIQKKVFTAEERLKLENIEAEANKYIHPDNHSADMIADSETRILMTPEERERIATIREITEVERQKLSIIDPWADLNEVVSYSDIVTYFSFDELGRIVRQVITDNFTDQNVKEPVLPMPDFPGEYVEGDSFLVTSVGEIYKHNGTDFVQLPTLVEVFYQYDNDRLSHKSISTYSVTPTIVNYDYFYDSQGNRIAVKKY